MAALCATSYVTAKVAQFIPILYRRIGLSPAAPTKVIPLKVWRVVHAYKFISAVVYITLNKLFRSIFSEKKSDFIIENLVFPIFEELEEKWVSQYFFLTYLPALVFKAVAPDHSYLLNTPAAKVTRVIISAGFFA